jgi:hypothetical protein
MTGASRMAEVIHESMMASVSIPTDHLRWLDGPAEPRPNEDLRARPAFRPERMSVRYNKRTGSSTGMINTTSPPMLRKRPVRHACLVG